MTVCSRPNAAICLWLLLAGLLLPGVALAQDGPAGYTVMGPVTRLPNGGRPVDKVPFPEIRDWGTLKITLTRGPCFGSCPSYTVEIDGDGTVRYNGGYSVAIAGRHTAKISPEVVRELVDGFRKADFFWLFDKYEARITDFPAYEVSVAFDGNSKTISDCVGPAIGMPPEVRTLEAAIDAAAGTEKWVNGNDATIPALKREGWNFHDMSDVNLHLLKTAAIRRNSDLVVRLLTEGVPANTPLGCEALQNTIVSHGPMTMQVVQALIAAGAPIHATIKGPPRDYTCAALLSAASSGDPQIVRLILNQHPDVNWQDSMGSTALFRAVQDWVFPTGGPLADYPAVIALLLTAGADPSISNGQGMTPLAYATKFDNRGTTTAALTQMLTEHK